MSLETPLCIGQYHFDTPLVLAPMAGITDRVFRQICRQLGAGLAFSEMTLANPQLRETRKTRMRADHRGESGPFAMQIAGGDPQQMAESARHCVSLGAEIIDINIGCPAKKVQRIKAGSALLSDTALIAKILDAVVAAVSVPITLKIRTGPDPQNRNAVEVAAIAEQSGISALTVHGRTRACRFNGNAEFDTIRQVRDATDITLIANGDITTPERAQQVLATTGADGIMIGRGALGRPWIFDQIGHFLTTGELKPEVSHRTLGAMMRFHIQELHSFYGDYLGPRVARKHINWYLLHAESIPLPHLKGAQPNCKPLRDAMMRAENLRSQILLLDEHPLFSVSSRAA